VEFLKISPPKMQAGAFTLVGTISNLVKKQADLHPSAIAIGAPGRSPLSYYDLYRQILETGEKLNRLGVGRKDTVAIILPNGPEMAVAFLSISSFATCAPLNPNYRQSEFEYYLRDLQVRAIIVQSEMESIVRDTSLSLNIPLLELTPISDGSAGLFSLNGDLTTPSIKTGLANLDDVALVLHTSGTTSKPKIVPLKHCNLIASAENISRSLSLTNQDRCLNVMPLFHIHGLMASILSSLACGASVICTPGFHAPNFFDWLAAHEPTWYTAVPTMHQAVLARSAENQQILNKIQLRFIRSCSAALPPQLMKELENVFTAPVVEAYGMTEASHQMTCNPLPPRQRKPGSVGIATGVEVAIMAEESDDLLTIGDVGEIVIRGPNVTEGYANNPDANARSFTKGWFRTGDQGYLDSDQYLFITGRIKEIINRGGEKISPREIDEVLLQHPQVLQAVTFAMPDKTLGEDIAAAVVAKDDSITESELRRFTNKHLAYFKVPKRIVILDEIPKGPTGKLQRIGLAEKLGIKGDEREAVHSEVAFIAPRDPVENSLADIWCEVLNLPCIGVFHRFLEVGGDSLLALQLVSRIREIYKIEISLLDFFEAPTIAEQAEIVQEFLLNKLENPRNQ
jgi:acyl-CoA synthetase (AMP-forming)/AMP-acid ligase II/acyl carrier protein